ncbi:MAG: alpha/beta hydrolase [Chloroflexi bacterium]|nr:alpha/beta hydrolase [Chloroflexota bacterium]
MVACSPPIVLIHGLWITSLCWERWIERYTQRGYKVIAPSWPGLDGDIEQLRRDPAPIARRNVTTIVNHYDRIIRGLERPPIIMGHSFGGAFVQLLVDRGLGTAGVAIDSGRVRGVLKLPFSTIRSASPILRNPANRTKAVALTPERFQYAFTNTLIENESPAVYRRHHVPGAGGVLFEGALANLNPGTALRVDFSKADRAPLLFIAGGADHIVPPSVNKANVGKCAGSKAVTGYREFPGRSHYTLGQSGWEEVADCALQWATSHRKPATAPDSTV